MATNNGFWLAVGAAAAFGVLWPARAPADPGVNTLDAAIGLKHAGEGIGCKETVLCDREFLFYSYHNEPTAPAMAFRAAIGLFRDQIGTSVVSEAWVPIFYPILAPRVLLRTGFADENFRTEFGLIAGVNIADVGTGSPMRSGGESVFAVPLNMPFAPSFMAMYHRRAWALTAALNPTAMPERDGVASLEARVAINRWQFFVTPMLMSIYHEIAGAKVGFAYRPGKEYDVGLSGTVVPRGPMAGTWLASFTLHWQAPQ